eukprot:292928_1
MAEIELIKQDHKIPFPQLRISLTHWVGDVWEIFCTKFNDSMRKAWWNCGLTLPFNEPNIYDEFKQTLIQKYAGKKAAKISNSNDMNEEIAEAARILFSPPPVPSEQLEFPHDDSDYHNHNH